MLIDCHIMLRFRLERKKKSNSDKTQFCPDELSRLLCYVGCKMMLVYLFTPSILNMLIQQPAARTVSNFNLALWSFTITGKSILYFTVTRILTFHNIKTFFSCHNETFFLHIKGNQWFHVEAQFCKSYHSSDNVWWRMMK